MAITRTREQRVVPIMTYIEPSIHSAMNQKLVQSPQSDSGYIRGLILKDLVESGILTKEDVANITGGIAA